MAKQTIDLACKGGSLVTLQKQKRRHKPQAIRGSFRIYKQRGSIPANFRYKITRGVAKKVKKIKETTRKGLREGGLRPLQKGKMLLLQEEEEGILRPLETEIKRYANISAPK